MIEQTLNLNLIPKDICPRLYVTQYDYGSRTLKFAIYNGNQRFTLTGGMSARIQGTKPDKHGFDYAATVNTSNNEITADLTQQMTAIDGEVECEIVINKTGERIGTLNFVLAVQAAGLNDETIVSDTELPDIVAQATAQMEAAAASALQAEGYAVGKQGGTAVESSSPYYHNNASYYNSQASSSASSANTNALKAEGYAVGKQNGTAVSSGTYYQNNASYYNSQAKSSATSASGSATTATNKASEASGYADSASVNALKAEGYAVGKQNGTAVSSGTYYHNNAEYYAQQAATYVGAYGINDTEWAQLATLWSI